MKLFRKKFALFFLIFLGVLYILCKSFLKNINAIKTETAYYSVVEDVIKAEGFAVKDEILIESEGQEQIIYRVDDGERVSKGGIIADVYNSEADAKTFSLLKSIDDEIKYLTELKRTEVSEMREPETLDTEINSIIARIQKYVQKKDFSQILKKRKKLASSMIEKRISMGKWENLDGRIETLNENKKKIESSVLGNSRPIKSKDAGYFVKYVDGYENAFSYKDVKNLNFSNLDFNKIQHEVKKNYLGKLINSVDWYIICNISEENKERIEKNVQYQLKIPSISEESVPCSVHEIKSNGDGTALLVICCRSMGGEIVNFRKGEINLKLNEYYGFKIRKKAVSYKQVQSKSEKQGNIPGVNVKCGNLISFRRINIVYSDNEYVVVSDNFSDDSPEIPYLKNGDMIVVEGTNLYDGKLIKC